MRPVFAAALGALWLFLPAAGNEIRKAPPIKTSDLAGQPIDSDKMLAKGPVLVDFWATWCVPCLAELKALQALHKTYGSLGLQIIAVSEDGKEDKAKVEKFVRVKKLEGFTVILDSDKTLEREFQSPGCPSVYLINTLGQITYHHSGYKSGDEKALEENIRKLLPVAEK